MKEKLLGAFSNLLDATIAATPKLIVGVVLIVVALLLAKLIEVILQFLLRQLRFDSLMKRAGIDKVWRRVGLRTPLHVLIPRLVYFLTLLVLARTAADAVGLGAISGAIGSLLAYLPNVFAALLLLIVGISIARFAAHAVEDAARHAAIDFAPLLGKLVSAFILFVVAMMALSQLQIDTNMVRLVTSFILGAVALAFGLAFGLGSREVVRNITAGFYLRKHLLIGRPLEIAGEKGLLKGITATHTILQAETAEISIANSTFLQQVVKQ